MKRGWLAVIALGACGAPAPQPAPAPRPAPFESVTGAGPPPSSTDGDKAIIRRHIKTRMAEIRACYEQVLGDHPGLAGRVDVAFVIELDGHAHDVHATGLDAAPSVASCVAAEVARIRFPKPQGGTVTVTYPFTFAPQPP